MKNNFPTWGAAVALCMPLVTAAQAGKADAPKALPQLKYQSAFADYKPYQDVSLASWRAVNDIVAGASSGASGHAGHGSSGVPGGGQIDKPPAEPAPTNPMHEGHQGHSKMPGGKP